MVKIQIQEDGITVNTLSLLTAKADSYGAKLLRQEYPITEVIEMDTGTRTFAALLASGQMMLVDGCTVDDLYPANETIAITVAETPCIGHSEAEDVEPIYDYDRAEPPLPPTATDALPGSVEKLAVIQWRLKRGYQLHHPNDRKLEVEPEPEDFPNDDDDWC